MTTEQDRAAFGEWFKSHKSFNFDELVQCATWFAALKYDRSLPDNSRDDYLTPKELAALIGCASSNPISSYDRAMLDRLETRGLVKFTDDHWWPTPHCFLIITEYRLATL